MKDSPLIIGLLVGLIVVLVIAGVSLLARMNSVSGTYKQQLAKTINLEKSVEELKAENGELENTIENLNAQIETMKQEYLKLEKLKEKLEENLKEELMKGELNTEAPANIQP